MMKKIWFLIALYMVMAGHAGYAIPSVEFDVTHGDLGSIEIGKAGWEYLPGRYFEVGVTCNIDTETPTWRLRVTAEDFNGGAFTAKNNLRLKVFYIGHSLPDPPYWEGREGEPQATDHLTVDFAGADFVSYTGEPMYICGAASRTGGTAFTQGQMKVVVAVTVLVPEGGSNIAGDYQGNIHFDIE